MCKYLAAFLYRIVFFRQRRQCHIHSTPLECLYGDAWFLFSPRSNIPPLSWRKSVFQTRFYKDPSLPQWSNMSVDEKWNLLARQRRAMSEPRRSGFDLFGVKNFIHPGETFKFVWEVWIQCKDWLKTVPTGTGRKVRKKHEKLDDFKSQNAWRNRISVILYH